MNANWESGVLGVPLKAAHYYEVVLAVSNTWPSTLFPRDLKRLTVADWSELCLLAFAKRRETVLEAQPGWLVVSAMRALGFGREALQAMTQTLNESPLPSVPDDPYSLQVMAQRAMAQAPSDRRGVLLIMRAGKSLAETMDYHPRAPIVAMREAALPQCQEFLSWLDERDLIEVVIDEAEIDWQVPVKPRSIKLPKGLDKLPRVVVTATPSSTSDQSEQENVLLGSDLA